MPKVKQRLPYFSRQHMICGLLYKKRAQLFNLHPLMGFKKKLRNIILGQPQKMVVTMHKRPDGDALGSALAFGKVLAQFGHDVKVVSPTAYPVFLGWMPGIEEVVVAETTNKKELTAMIEQATTIFCLDFAEYHRLGIIADEVRNASATKMVIDHHPLVEHMISDGDQLFCLPEVPATAMILYDLLVDMGMEKAIDEDMATCLYVGVVSDTGFFVHKNVNANAHLIAAKLMNRGLNVHNVHYQLTSNTPLYRLYFIAHAIAHRLVVLPEQHLAYFAIPRSDIKKFKLKTGDTGGLISYALNIENIYVAGLLTEQKNSVHISLRSLGNLPMNKLSEAHFNGGGHMNAAGGIAFTTLEAVGKKLEQVARDLLQQYAVF